MENNLIQIKEYAKPKKGEGGSGGKITYNINGADIGSSLKLKSLQANRILSDYIESNTVKAGTGDFVYLVASDGTISTLRGDHLDYSGGHIGDLIADSIETDKLKVNDTATIKNIFNDYLSSREIVTDYLTVNKAAHFFEVVIDKIRSVGGTIINTATNCVIDYVEPVIKNGITTGYKCYWKQTNNEDDYVSNDWLPNDQAISQNCNLVAGVNHNTGTHYYWRLVKSTSNEDTQNGPMFVNFETGEAKPGTYDDEKEVYVAPEYEVTFVPFSGTDYIFKYDNGQDDEEGSFPVTVTDWNISGQIIDEEEEDNWDEEHNVLTVTDTLHGLQLIPNNVTETIGGVEQEKYPNIRRGHFTFNTSVNTNLNVMIMFDDDTIEYRPANGPKTAYDIEIKNVNNAIVTMIVITSDVVDVWHACHWIVLGNETGEFDTPANDYVINGSHVVNWDNIPAKGDNIAQLGYRYQNLDGYENTKAWKDAHKDEVSRSSAIIIAAYKTPDAGITPPSYAQYKNITDFNLASHRHTYFDAEGSKFYGNFYIGPDNGSDDISDYTPISDLDAEVYKIIPDTDVITKDTTNSITPSSIKCKFIVPKEADAMTVVPPNCIFKWYIDRDTPATGIAYGADGDQHPQGEQVQISISNMTSYITMVLLKDGNILDQITKSLVNINVASGKDGSYTQWIYKYLPKTTTSVDLTYPVGADKSKIPQGWSLTQPEWRAADTYLWYATRLVTYNQNNQPDYSNPWVAARLQGADGEPGHPGLDGTNGLDGTDFEFIYKHFAGPQSFGNNSNNPAYWKGTQGDAYDVDDYVGPGTGAQGTGFKWCDHPQGVNTSYPYEYMSQRTSYTGEDGKEWNSFTNPTLWSKYGENGMDGDGVEYIFCLTADENHVPELWQTQNDFNAQEGTYYSPGKFANVEYSNSNITRWRGGTKGSNYSNTAEWHDASLSEYLPPNNQLGYVTSAQSGAPVSTWTDDPQGVSSQYKVEWVSQRRYDGRNKKWGEFSDPSIWAKYSVGTQGPAGPQGNNGRDGTNGQDGESAVVYKLVDVNSTGNVQVSLSDIDNNMSQTLNLNLTFRVMQCIGEDSRFLRKNEISDKYVYYRMWKSSNYGYTYYKINLKSDLSDNDIAEFTFSDNFPDNNQIINNKNIIVSFIECADPSFNETSLNNFTVYDSTNISVTLQPAAMINVVNNTISPSIRSLVTGQQGLESQYTSMYQTMGEIRADVDAIGDDYVNHAELSITSERIKSEVISEVSDQFPATFIKTIDLTQLNNSYWYPVGITLEPNNTENQRIVIERPLLMEYGQPDYGSDLNSKPASENRGFSLICDWITRWSGWGANWGPSDEKGGDSYESSIYDEDQGLYVRQKWVKAECNGYGLDKYRYINDYKPHWTRVVDGIPEDCLAGSIRQNYESNEEFIYLRGGSKYDVKTGWDGTQVKVYVTQSEYSNVSSSERPAYWTVGYTDTASGHTRHVLQRIINYEDLILPVKDAMKRSEIIQTADNIQLNVYNDLKQTGINITNGQIDLNANNTNIFGNLNLKNSTDGIILYDSSGNARVNILPSNIPDPNTSGGFDSRNHMQFYSAEVTKSNISDDVDARTSRPSIGYLQSNTTITFDIEPGIYGIASSINSYIANNIPSITVYFYIYSSETVISSTSTTLYRSGSTGSYTYPSFTHTYTFDDAGYYSIEMRLSGNDSNDRYTKYTVNAFVDYNKKVDSLTYVGLDGVLVGTAKTKYAKISKDGYEFRWIDQLDNKSDAIKMSANGLQRVYNFDNQNGPLSWVGISGYKPVTIVDSSNVTLITTSNPIYAGSDKITRGYYYLVQPNDCNIMIVGGGDAYERSKLYIRLTDGIGSTDGYPMAGRCIYIRSFRNNEDIYVVHGDKTYNNGDIKKVILSRNDKTVYTNKQQIHDDTYMFMAIPGIAPTNNEIAYWAIYSQFTGS